VILVDTSVWIEHLRSGVPDLTESLNTGIVWCHPFVIGELACGNLRNRAEVLELLGNLPTLPVATNDEVLAFIERRGLMGRGVGYIDVHLLAAVLLEPAARIWTLDRRLATLAAELNVVRT
jgi:predicted nucleic acid-binding protein